MRRQTPMLLFLLAAAPVGATEVQVQVRGVNGPAGVVHVEVCREPEWLKDCALSGEAPARRGVVTVVVPDVPPGVYAVSAFHDIRHTGKVEQDILGIPRVGVGFSRDPLISIGPPSFAGSALQMAGPRVVVPLTLKFEPRQ